MNRLVDWTIEAHGGLARWRRFERVSARLRTGGVLWALKGQPHVLDDVRVTAALHHEHASHEPFVQPGWRTAFEPQRVAIETLDGAVIEERLQPREAFAGHALETPWDRLHLAYFAGYAMWTYFTAPFVFAEPGVLTEEIDPWVEQGDTWRRLKVTFPAGIATHSAVQIFHVGPDGLFRRHDYHVDVAAASPAAHYVQAYESFSGLFVPTRRRVYPRLPDGAAAAEPTLVTIDLSDVAFA